MKAVDLGRLEDACPAAWHGTASAYTRAGCRCPHAREARRVYAKRRKNGRLPDAYVDSLATARRLRALAAIGWRFGDLGARLGVSAQAVRAWALVVHPKVCRSTENAIRGLYEQLRATPGPSVMGRSRALGKRWAPPAAWVGVDMGSELARPDWSRVDVPAGSRSRLARLSGEQQRKGQAA